MFDLKPLFVNLSGILYCTTKVNCRESKNTLLLSSLLKHRLILDRQWWGFPKTAGTWIVEKLTRESGSTLGRGEGPAAGGEQFPRHKVCRNSHANSRQPPSLPLALCLSTGVGGRCQSQHQIYEKISALSKWSTAYWWDTSPSPSLC